MMKPHMSYPARALAAGVLLCALFVGCTNEIEQPAAAPDSTGKQITITATQSPPGTRLAYNDPADGSDGLDIVWAPDDAFMLLSLYDLNLFTIVNSTAGFQSARFTGTEPEPQTEDYYAVYPASAGGGKVSKASFDITGQVQIGDSRTHLSKYNFMKATIPPGSLSDPIAFEHQVAILKFSVILPDNTKRPRTFALSVNGTSEFVVVESVEGDVMTTSQELRLHINDTPTPSLTHEFTVWMTVLPVTLHATDVLTATVECIDGTKYFFDQALPAGGITYQPGRIYATTLGGVSKPLQLIDDSSWLYSEAIALQELPDYEGYYLTTDVVNGVGAPGSQNNPYLISSANDLRFFQLILENGGFGTHDYFQLTTDIRVDTGSASWKPFFFFSGSFDGAGHTISGKLEGPDWDFGLFGYVVGNGANQVCIKNLNITADIVAENGSCVGSIVSTMDPLVECDNCTFSGTITTPSLVIGGIVGKIAFGGWITNCSMYGRIIKSNDTSSSDVYVGGIVGRIEHPGAEVYSCLFSGSIQASSSKGNMFIGGISGGMDADNSIRESVNKGSIFSSFSGDDGKNCYIGGITGSCLGSLGECVQYGTLKAEAVSASSTLFMGGIAGGMENDTYMHSCHNQSIAFGLTDEHTGVAYLGRLAGQNAGNIYDCCTTIPVPSWPNLVGDNPDFVFKICDI